MVKAQEIKKVILFFNRNDFKNLEGLINFINEKVYATNKYCFLDCDIILRHKGNAKAGFDSDNKFERILRPSPIDYLDDKTQERQNAEKKEARKYVGCYTECKKKHKEENKNLKAKFMRENAEKAVINIPPWIRYIYFERWGRGHTSRKIEKYVPIYNEIIEKMEITRTRFVTSESITTKGKSKDIIFINKN